MSDPKSEPDKPDAPPKETAAAADTVAANVDAPAQEPDAVSAPSDDPAPAVPPADAVAGAATEAGAADSVAANVDAPAETPQGSEADTTPTEPVADATRPLPAQDGPAGGDGPGGDGPGGDGPGGGDAAAGGSGGAAVAAAAPAKKRRNPWPTVGTLVAVLVILAGIGYFGGLGPLNRLSQTRDLHPPDQVAGLDRITDPTVRERYQLDATRDALRRINNGKKATVEAYGKIGGKTFMVLALRGKVNIDKEIRDSGANPDQVRKVGKSTCASSVQDIPASCYRASNTLTVIAQGLDNTNDIDAIGAFADEAFEAMK